MLDNEKIHMLKELEDSVHQCGARLVSLSPCSPERNHIEVHFGQLKIWIQKHASLAFPLFPELLLDVAMATYRKNTLVLHGHCMCDNRELYKKFFDDLLIKGNS